jgi:hypothetical protein
LIVDSSRSDYLWPNATYQKRALREIAEFLGKTQAVLFTPGGMVATEVSPLSDDLESLRAGLDEMSNALEGLERGALPLETLLGVDGCIPGKATPLQTVVHLRGSGASATTSNTTVKLYPAGGEAPFLAGWRIVRATGSVPEELTQARCLLTSAGPVLVLVCHDACLFSARSWAKLKKPLGAPVRDHLYAVATAAGERRPAFTLIASHWRSESAKSGTVFKDAAKRIADRTRSTVVTTTFAPKASLENAAMHSPTEGQRADQVVTLLVENPQ